MEEKGFRSGRLCYQTLAHKVKSFQIEQSVNQCEHDCQGAPTPKCFGSISSSSFMDKSSVTKKVAYSSSTFTWELSLSIYTLVYLSLLLSFCLSDKLDKIKSKQCCQNMLNEYLYNILNTFTITFLEKIAKLLKPCLYL